MSKKHRSLPEGNPNLTTLIMPIYEERLETALGNRLRDLRRQQGISLRLLAEKSGLSANTLSLIENGKTSPSVSTLQQIAIALQIPLTAFFDLNPVKRPVVYSPADSVKMIRFQHGEMAHLGDQPGEGLQPYLVRYEPGTDTRNQPLEHTGIEYIYCTEGEIHFIVNEQEYTLKKGDSLYFDSLLPHSWLVIGDQPAVVITILCQHDEQPSVRWL